ncbi:hypothetical protein [Polaribacter sp. IC073]|uniref:hypothetical protein n=1 Tax=Polaribacter sp. IC073 TaxID=2508540 RepID=UPI0011BFD0AF|nr:hypothetical protein [Polaribacter sp. IC073]TXD45986.1 hypothetical protein ES045_15450 [Polaribacter sp. IC073]
MNKAVFYISAIISILLLVNIFQILTNDFERLTEYGFGYLIGKVILFVIFLTFLLLTKKSILKDKETE